MTWYIYTMEYDSAKKGANHALCRDMNYFLGLYKGWLLFGPVGCLKGTDSEGVTLDEISGPRKADGEGCLPLESWVDPERVPWVCH